MLLVPYFGPPIYTQSLGSVTAEVYSCEEGYKVFIVGENLASYLGVSDSLEDCKEEIRSLECLVESQAFQQEIAIYR